MNFIDDIAGWLKNQVLYMTGRGLLGVGILGGAWLGMGSTGMMVAAVVGTIGVRAAVTWRSERRVERQLLMAYRDEVGSTLGMDPKAVTIKHLQQLSQSNPVIEEALNRNAKRHVMQFVTSGIAGLATLLVSVSIPGLTETVAAWRDTAFNAAGLTFLGDASIIAGAMLVAGTGMSIINKILDFAGERVLDIHKPTAHDLIVGIRRDIARGKIIQQEQVFGVFVAANPDLAAQIEEEFGRPYDSLNPRQQHIALEQCSKGMPTSRLTYELNHYMIDPEELAFAAVGQESGVPKRADIDVREQAFKEKTTGELVEEVTQALKGTDRDKPRPVAAANDNAHGFAKHYAPRASEGQSFVDRYAPESRSSHLERVLEQARKAQAAESER